MCSQLRLAPLPTCRARHGSGFSLWPRALRPTAELRRVLGDVAAGRGWPRRGDEEIRIAASLAPDDKAVQVALAESALRRLRWREARQRIDELAELYPGDLAVQRAGGDLAAYDSWELRTEFRFHYEAGTPQEEAGGNSPGKGFDFITRLYSPPIAERWRLVAGWEYHQADVTEGLAQRYREGVGFEWRLPDFTLEAIFWYNHGSLAEPGGSVAARWAPTDQWTFRGEAERFAADTPLRAVLNGVTADLVGVGVEYAWNESRALALGAQWYDFSDDNDRQAVTLTFAQRVVDIPHFDLTVRPQLYTSRNDRNDVPYFSPLLDFSAAVALRRRAPAVEALRAELRPPTRRHRGLLLAGGFWHRLDRQRSSTSRSISTIRALEMRYGAQFEP